MVELVVVTVILRRHALGPIPEITALVRREAVV